MPMKQFLSRLFPLTLALALCHGRTHTSLLYRADGNRTER